MLEQIEEWYREAASLHGDDWSNIESYVANKIAAASSTNRTQLLERIWFLLRNKDEILH